MAKKPIINFFGTKIYAQDLDHANHILEFLEEYEELYLGKEIDGDKDTQR